MLAAVAALIGWILDQRAIMGAVLFALGVPLILAFPAYAFEINALDVMVALTWVAWIWRR